MGEKPLANHDLRRAMQLIDNGYFKRARKVIESPHAAAVDTGAKFVGMQESALYHLTSALIWLLQNNDAAWKASRKKAWNTDMGRSSKLETETLYEYVTLLIRHNWRSDKIESLLQEILDHPASNRVHRTRTLTAWGKFLRGQKDYGEARKKLAKARSEWVAIQSRPGRILTADEKRWMAETNWLLLKTLIKLGGDKEEIDHLASWAIWNDPSLSHKTAAARFRVSRRKTKTTSDA